MKTGTANRTKAELDANMNTVWTKNYCANNEDCRNANGTTGNTIDNNFNWVGYFLKCCTYSMFTVRASAAYKLQRVRASIISLSFSGFRKI
jgi:hypothetical protein